MPRAGAARSAEEGAQRVAAAHLGAGGMAGAPEGAGRLHVLEAPNRIRKPSRERRRESLAGSAKDAHGEGTFFRTQRKHRLPS